MLVNLVEQRGQAPAAPPSRDLILTLYTPHQHIQILNTALLDPEKSEQRHNGAIRDGATPDGNDNANFPKSALRELERRQDVITISRTSFLYESDPMYVEDQSKFLNCAIMAETTLEPMKLLRLLKHVEEEVGRVKSLRYGPRAIDLDIIFYDSITFDNRKKGGDGSNDGELVIPHARMCEREFVLRPLLDIIPNYVHPGQKISVHSLFNQRLMHTPSTVHKVLPFPSPSRHPDIPSTLWPLSIRTYLMATINATPDSFSSSAPSTTAAAVDQALTAAGDGADIIDVGGYSTRPGATPVPVDEELSRVIPVIRMIRERGIILPVSVDTFRPAVLRAAVEAGANCLNDVTALAGEKGDGVPWEMATVVRELGVPVVMMHSRGAHRAGEDKDYGASGVLVGVQEELGRRVDYALRCGIRRWNMLVDPGFGFSKTTADNVELLRRFREVTANGEVGCRPNSLRDFPTLVGLSRKSFLGHLIGRKTEPQDRDLATAVAVTAAVQQSVDIVRVHRVAEIRDVLRIADAIWRKVR